MLRESEKHAEHPLYWAFDTKELLKGDMKTRFDAYKVALESNFMQIDEVRYQEDLRRWACPGSDWGCRMFCTIQKPSGSIHPIPAGLCDGRADAQSPTGTAHKVEGGD